MKKREFKNALYALLDAPIDGLSFDEQISFVEQVLIEYQKDNEVKRDISNKGKKWTDEDLKIILMDAPSKANCMKYAKLFHRGYGSIEQIYRWSTTTMDEINQTERANDAFILQIKKVAKELGLRG